MPKRYYPVKTSHNSYPVKRRNNVSPITNNSIPNIFQNNQRLGREIAKGRIHCVAVEKTAIYKDAQGNQIVLKENQTSMNLPDSFKGGLHFRNSNQGNWRKK